MDKKVAIAFGILGGALALILFNQTLKKRNSPSGEGIDSLGKKAIKNVLAKTKLGTQPSNKLTTRTLVTDILTNALYYSLSRIGRNKKLLTSEGLLSLTAGIGATVLPKYFGSNRAQYNSTLKTKLLTTALNAVGGFVASVATRKLTPGVNPESH